MGKYGKTITLETIDSYHPIKFTVNECEKKDDVDKEIKQWLKDYPELFEIENNKKILRMALSGK